jgi:hypothetical protein
VGLRGGLDTDARGKILSPLSGIEPRSAGRPARSQTLYCLSYPDGIIQYYLHLVFMLFCESKALKQNTVQSSMAYYLHVLYTQQQNRCLRGNAL